MANRTIRFWQSISFKLAITFVLLLFLCIEIASSFFIYVYEKQVFKDVENDLTSHLQQVAPSIGTELENRKTLDEINKEIQKQINILNDANTLRIFVIDKEKTIRAAIGENSHSLIGKKNELRDLEHLTAKQNITLINGRKTLVNVLPIQTSLNKMPIGAIYTETDLEKEFNGIHEMIFLFSITFGISISISILIALIISRSLTSPIKKMQEKTRRIAYGDYTNQLKVENYDELSQLELSINDLSNQIQNSQTVQQIERERLNSVLENMNDGVIATNFQGKILLVNEMALIQLNLENQEVIGQSILSLLNLEKDYTLQTLLEKTPQFIFDYGESSIFHLTFSVIETNTEFINGLVVVLQDITEQQKMEREHQQFVSNVSHELRTPLTSIHSYLETLENGAWKDENVAPGFLNTSLKECERMIRMINDLLQLSKIDSKNLPLNLEAVNFNHFLGYVLDRFDMMFEKSDKTLTIIRQFTAQALWVEIDADKMTQVIDNLLNNAYKYSHDGGKIQVKLMDTPKNVLLSISDHGMGIPRKDLKKIFERFYRTDPSRSRDKGGTGLGLAISKEIMHAFHGHIWAISQLGKGSTFFLTLPYATYQEEDDWE